jgi:endo-1,4-beta-D-glucanase Y
MIGMFRVRAERMIHAFVSSLSLMLVVAAAGAIGLGCAASGSDSGSGQGGAGGDMGGTGGTGAPLTCMTQAAPAPANGANFPFPQHQLSQSCGYPPNCNDADVQTAYDRWKQTFVVSAGGSQLRVQRTESANDTVSEGIGYGMLLSVYMADKATFDGLWAYAQAHLDGKGLMNWHYNSSGGVAGSGSATDADEDMAFALMMADKQWGGYSGVAMPFIAKILANEVDGGNLLEGGDGFGNSSQLNPSYFAPAYYKAFATYTGVARWNQVASTAYTVLGKCANAITGLVPDWCNASGAAITAPGGSGTSYYYYDATRTPWRLTLDACWNNDPTAKQLLAKMSTFFTTIGAAQIKDGYALDGTVKGTSNNMAFVGPATTSGMSPNSQQLLQQGYARVGAAARAGTGGSYTYYNASWGVLSLMLLTGNFVSFGAP